MKVRVLAAVAALMPVAVCGAARADNCAPLKPVAHVQIDMSGGVPVIPVSINGTTRHFLYDTGGAVAQISPATVSELSLKAMDSRLQTFDANGNSSAREAIADTFAVDHVKTQNVRFQVASAALTKVADGLIVPASLPLLDVDIDFGPGRFTYFLQDHCAGQVLYWKADAVAVVPITLKDDHLNVPVTLDGKKFRAIIDTGAGMTFIDMAEAKRVFGVTPDSPGVTMDGHVNGDPKLPIYGHNFSTLTFGDVTFTNPHVGLMADRMSSKDANNDFQTGSRISHADDELINLPEVIIGMNLLKKMHIYIAYKERNLYITPASAPDSPSPFAPPAK